MKKQFRFLVLIFLFSGIFVTSAQKNTQGVFSDDFKMQKGQSPDTKDAPIFSFPSLSTSALGVDYDPVRGGLWVACETGNAYLHDVNDGTLMQTLSLVGISLAPDGYQDGVDVLPNGNLLFADYNGDLANIDDYLFEVDPDAGTLVNYWPLDGTWNTSTDGTNIDVVIDVALGANGNYFVTSITDNTIYEIALTPGSPGTWETIDTHTPPTMSGSIGIDRLGDYWLISDFNSTTVVITDETFTEVSSFAADHANTYNTGVCFINRTDPVHIAVTDFNTDEIAVFESSLNYYAPITYIVDNTANTSFTGFALKGSWNLYGDYDVNWNNGEEHTDFYDDGTHGDVTAADDIWTVMEYMAPDGGTNPWEWGVNDQGANWIDGNFPFTVTDNTAQTLEYATVGVNEISNENISIFPNPSNGVFNISTENNFDLKVLDITGKIIKTQVLSGNSTVEINTAGVYFFRFTNEEGTVTQRVVVQ